MRADLQYRSIPRMAQEAARRFQDRAAVVDGDLTFSFADLERDMFDVARSLIASGVVPGDRVAVWAPNSAAWIPTALGILATGAWLVPLNTRFKGAEAAYILEKTDARVLFAVGHFLDTDRLEMLRAEAPRLRAVAGAVELPEPGSYESPGWSDFLARGSGVGDDEVRARLDAIGPDDVSDIMFTSGTTGYPKGAMLRHGTSLRCYESFNAGYGLGEDDHHLVATPFFHCFGYKAGWMLSLMAGATTVPMSVFDGEEALRVIERERITHIPGPPTIFWSILDHPRRKEFDLSSLRTCVVSAATVPVTLLERLADELDVQPVSGYGLTENHALVSVSMPGDAPDIVATTVGRIIPDLEVRVVDDEGHDVPHGQQGELLVRGYAHMSGYYDEPEATAAVIVDGWLHTGDIVTLDERGYLKITDRKKDMYIMGGFNVAPAEVEKALLGLHGVAQVAVVGMPDEHFGEVGAAFVVPKPGAAVTPDDVVEFARERLANFKVPRRVEIRDELPMNATGKVLKGVLRDQLRTGG